VLDGLPELQVCTGYRCRGALLSEMPGDVAQLAACEPIYETLRGWSKPTRGARRYEELPREAQAYIARIEEITGVPAAILSTGSDREDTIIRESSVADAWFEHART
jgi:adenylosuccinate synthase